MRTSSIQNAPFASTVRIPAGEVWCEGDLHIPAGAQGLVLFAHGSGSSRHSPRNQFVARVLEEAGLGTLLFDLLTRPEERSDSLDGHLRFDIGFLARRLEAATRWVIEQPATQHLGLGCFGSSTGAAAALVATAELGPMIGAVVSRGGRPDLAAAALRRVKCPTLLIVGGDDDVVLELNRDAYALLAGPKELKIIPGATHLFEEPGTLEQVADAAAGWFVKHLQPH
ncbi:MAG TPA: dienelactone hydrolase family protein [Verrucomicrobiae bacterium]|jgi:dienelactone hydrolase